MSWVNNKLASQLLEAQILEETHTIRAFANKVPIGNQNPEKIHTLKTSAIRVGYGHLLVNPFMPADLLDQ